MEIIIGFFGLCSILLFVFCIAFIPIAIVIIIYYIYSKNKEEYEKSSYYKITKVPYANIKENTGRYGEYLTYVNLKKFETDGAKLLFNLYIPKENCQTTEIDALMISKKGIFVFESKNYSGWIFGNETQKNWYQTLPRGRNGIQKDIFYNPVLQNATHIKFLQKLIGEDISMQSIIVFSNRCTLKKISISSKNVFVIKRYNLTNLVTRIFEMTEKEIIDENQINEIYNKLYPYTQVEQAIKLQHIANIKK